MNIKYGLIILLLLPLMLGISKNVIAGKVYQWIDEEGSVHFSDVQEDDTSTVIAYKSSVNGQAYQWTDEEGGVQFSDVPPVNTPAIGIREIKIDKFNDNTIDQEQYSIVNQAERMAERRRQVEDERLTRKRLKFEEYRIAQELKIIRLNERFMKQGYGPRPYYYPYSESYY